MAGNSTYARLAEEVVQQQHNYETEFARIDAEHTTRAEELAATRAALDEKQRERSAIDDAIERAQEDRMATLAALTTKVDAALHHDVSVALEAEEDEMAEVRRAVDGSGEMLLEIQRESEDAERATGECLDAVAETTSRRAQLEKEHDERVDFLNVMHSQTSSAVTRSEQLDAEERALHASDGRTQARIAHAAAARRTADAHIKDFVAELADVRNACHVLHDDTMRLSAELEGLADTKQAVVEERARQHDATQAELQQQQRSESTLAAEQRKVGVAQTQLAESRTIAVGVDSAIEELRTRTLDEEVRDAPPAPRQGP